MRDLPDDALRPRRSVLYLPATNERALAKAATLPTDAVILDLEDAVAPDVKDAAREQACAAVTQGTLGHREVAVRVNGIDTDWFADDVAAVVGALPDALLVPKVGSADDVARIESALAAAGAPEQLRLWAMLETPAAVLDAREICGASSRLNVLVMGTNDLANELHATPGPGRAPLLPALSWCLTAARDAGRTIIDGVFNDLEDPDGFEDECRQGRAYGFDGKTLIHPRQIEPCNRVFAPDAADVEEAHRIIAAFEEARTQGRGVVTVDGRMVENLHVEQARRTVAQARAIGLSTD